MSSSLEMHDAFDTRSLSERVYGLLLNEIVSGRLAANAQVDIDELARQLHISRTPIKESLNRLAAEGLVDIVPRRGTFVSRSHPRRLLELLDVRLMLEEGCSDDVAARADEAGVAALRAELDQMREFSTADVWRAKVDDFVKLDQAFHIHFVSLAGNAELDRLYERLHVHMHIGRVFYPSATIDLDRTMVEHEAIVEALERRDGPGLRQVVRDHIGRVRGFVAATLEPEAERA
jgi:DNA-binding GntR family transcriptional regulator